MAWKKPKIVSNIQKAAQKGANKLKDAVVPKIAQAVTKPAANVKSGPILPGIGAALRGVRDVVYGAGDVLASPVDGNFVKGVKKIGSGAADTVYHTGRGLIVDPLVQMVGGAGSKGSVEETTKGDKIGGQSGGAAITPLPPAPPEADGAIPTKLKNVTVIPPTPLINNKGTYLTEQAAPAPTKQATPTSSFAKYLFKRLGLK